MLRRWRRRRRAEWSLHTELGDGWYPLALELGPKEFENAVARALADGAMRAVGRSLAPEEARERASEVAEWAEVVREQPGAVEGAVLRTRYDGPVEALLVMSVSSPPSDWTLERWLEEYLQGAETVVTEERLQVGPALRVHEVGEADPEDPEDSAVEAVGFAFHAPDGDIVWHQLTWEGHGDHRFCDTADQIAAGLTFT